jgi:hypothetical protein
MVEGGDARGNKQVAVVLAVHHTRQAHKMHLLKIWESLRLQRLFIAVVVVRAVVVRVVDGDGDGDGGGGGGLMLLIHCRCN